MIRKIFNLNYLIAIGLYLLGRLVHPVFEKAIGGPGTYQLNCGIGGYCGEWGCVDNFSGPKPICSIEDWLFIIIFLAIVVFLIFGIIGTIKSLRTVRQSSEISR